MYEADIVAIQTALSSMGIPLSLHAIAACVDRPFMIVGSEEWLDRATLQLYPRMQTTVPDELIAFRTRQYAQLREYGVRVHGRWCHDVPAVQQYVETCDPATSAVVLIWNTEHPLPVLQRTDGRWTTGEQENRAWMEEIQSTHTANGFYVVTFAVSEIESQGTLAQQIARARDLLASREVFRFPTPNHPLRVYQAWHVGAASLSVIAFAAQEAAPLSIVSDTVQQVFAVFRQRAQDALRTVDEWQARDLHREQHLPFYEALRTQYLDVLYLYEIVCVQFPADKPTRALSLAEGALIAEVCKDTRLIVEDICGTLGLLVRSMEEVVGRPGFEPGTKSL